MQGRIKVVTAPATEPITLAEALQHCHCVTGVENAWFTRAIQVAREATEEYLKRALIQQTIEIYFDSVPELPLLLPRSPVISVVSGSVYDVDNDETALDITDFNVDTDSDPAIIDFNYGETWPSVTLRDLKSVKFQYTAGYGTTASSVPAKFKMAMLVYINYWYENRASEMQEPPQAFYNLLRPERLHL